MEALLNYASTSMTNPGNVAVEVLHGKPDLEVRLFTDSDIGPNCWSLPADNALNRIPRCIIRGSFGESIIKHLSPDRLAMPLCLFN